MTRKKNKKTITLNTLSSIKEDNNDIKEDNNDMEEDKNNITEDNNVITDDKNDIREDNNVITEDNNDIRDENNDIRGENNDIREKNNYIKNESFRSEIKDLDILFYKNQNSNLIFKIIELEKTIEDLNEQVDFLNEKLENSNDKNKKMKMLNILKEHKTVETNNEHKKDEDEQTISYDLKTENNLNTDQKNKILKMRRRRGLR